MKRLLLTISTFLVTLIPMVSPCQNPCVGIGAAGCTLEESRQAQEKLCKAEPSPPNLSVASPVRLTGVLLDQTGAPIAFGGSAVQIKDPKTDAVLQTVPLNAKGQFDLESISAGQFRFVVVLLENEKPVRLPSAYQPRALSCPSEKECRLEIVIHFHGTDDPIDFCPPK